MLCLSRTVCLCSSAGYSLVSSAIVVLLVGRSLCVEPSDLSSGIYAGLYQSKSHSQKLNPTGNARVNSRLEGKVDQRTKEQQTIETSTRIRLIKWIYKLIVAHWVHLV